MPLETEIRQHIDCDTFEECKEKLFKLYGQNYKIEKKDTILKNVGFLGLRQKEITRVYYTVPHANNYNDAQQIQIQLDNRKKEAELLEKNRQEIIQKNSTYMMNATLAQLNSKIDELNSQIVSMNKTIKTPAPEVHETITKIEELLSENEFTLPYIRMITDKIREQFSLEQLEDFKLVQRYVVDWIGESIEIAKDKAVRPPRVIVIVGPTGVGKTTTIAKLASNSILDAKKSGSIKPEICIITIDTMRVGAQEQLAKFGEILQKNVLKAETADDLREIYEQYKEHVDYIFIDTSGYSPNDATHISEMKNLLNIKMNPTVYLSVTASTKASDLHNIFRNYELFDYESVIVTKCDETKQLGNIISVLWEKHKSISYITDGQRVPRNIQKADVIEILKNLTGFDIDRVHIEDKFGEK